MHIFNLPQNLEKFRILEYGESIKNKIHALEKIHIKPKIDEIHIPYDDFYFDYTISFNYFFKEEDKKNLEFHMEQLRELARVSKEVRIYPINNSYAVTSPLIGPLLLSLQQENYGTAIYHIDENKENSAMLCIWAQLCHIS